MDKRDIIKFTRKNICKKEFVMKKIIKYILIVPFYIFLLLEGAIGGTVKLKDIWDDLIKWASK